MARVELYINGILSSARAIFADDMKLEWARENNEMFHRLQVSNDFRFVNDDFNLIYEADMDADFEIRITDESAILAVGKFEKTDCEFNVDDRICRVKVTTTDRYNKILANIGNEYDLIQLAPAREKIGLTKRAILQLYIYHDVKITNVIGNMSYEVNVADGIDVDNLTDSDIQNNYNFTLSGASLQVITLSNAPQELKYLEGVYSGQAKGISSVYMREDGEYRIVPFRLGSSVYLYGLQTKYGEPVSVLTDEGWQEIHTKYTPTLEDEVTDFGWGGVTSEFHSLITATSNYNAFYARILMDTDNPSSPLGVIKRVGSEDICGNNLNYHYTMQTTGLTGLGDLLVSSAEVQSSPTPWGVNGEGKYYVRPDAKASGDNVIPVGWSRWIPDSFWFNSTPEVARTIDRFDVSWNLNDAYPLWSALKVLLGKVDDSLSFEPSSECSEFLFGDVSQAISHHIKQSLYLTPATNVEKTFYNQAARKCKITLRQVLDMLRNLYQLYWYIDESNRFHLEHITYFKNGGTYDFSQPMIDLSEVYSYPTAKAWAFGQNTITYDKSSLIKRYEFDWDTECSEAFEGFPIDIKNKFVGNGGTNKASISKFIADIDLLISSPDAVNDDSIVVIGVNPTTKKCPIAELTNLGMDIKSPIFYAQNGFLSFFFTEIVYWLYNMSAEKAETSTYKSADGGDGKLSVYDTVRMVRQKVVFPLDKSLFGKQGTIVTPMGEGEWVKESYNIESGVCEAEILFPNNGQDYLLVSPRVIDTTYHRRDVDVAIKASAPWGIIGTSAWCRITKMSDTKLIVSIDENNSDNARSASFDIVMGDKVSTILVNQQSLTYDFTYEPFLLTFDSSGVEGGTINITTNDRWYVGNLPTWMTASRISGYGNASITFNANDNQGNKRDAVIKLETEHCGTWDLFVEQLSSDETYVVKVRQGDCIQCGNCYSFIQCPADVFHIVGGVPQIDKGCIGCSRCISEIECPTSVFYWGLEN